MTNWLRAFGWDVLAVIGGVCLLAALAKLGTTDFWLALVGLFGALAFTTGLYGMWNTTTGGD